jgi:hypothetical protein
MKLKQTVFATCLVLALTSVVLAQCDATKCTDFNGTFVLNYSGLGWAGTADHQSSDHEVGLSVYTKPKQYAYSQCHYQGGGPKQPDGCWSCQTRGDTLIPLGYYSADSASNTHYSNEQHCINSAAYLHDEPATGYLIGSLYTGAAIALGVSKVPNGVSCNGNSVNISLSNYYDGGIGGPGTNSFLFNFTAQNNTYGILDDGHWEQNLYCPYEESTTGTPIVLSWTPFQQAFSAMEVQFDVYGRGSKVLTTWTQGGAQTAFLVLPDQNGQVTSCKFQMFGNLTPQVPIPGTKLGGEHPHPYSSNGIEAMRVFDLNKDNVIDKQDAVWSQLRLWFNYAHDGIYDPANKPNEIKTLDEMGIVSFDIALDDYHQNNDTDQYGNVKRWVLSAKTAPGFVTPEVYDVQFKTQ